MKLEYTVEEFMVAAWMFLTLYLRIPFKQTWQMPQATNGINALQMV